MILHFRRSRPSLHTCVRMTSGSAKAVVGAYSTRCNYWRFETNFNQVATWETSRRSIRVDPSHSHSSSIYSKLIDICFPSNKFALPSWPCDWTGLTMKSLYSARPVMEDSDSTTRWANSEGPVGDTSSERRESQTLTTNSEALRVSFYVIKISVEGRSRTEDDGVADSESST